MGKAAFSSASTQWKPWWFTHEEVRHLDAVRHFQSQQGLNWVMKDATPSPEIDAIMFTAGKKYVCVSKRIDQSTDRSVYDVSADGENIRTVRTFEAVHAAFARALQLQSSLGHLWTKIEERLHQETHTLK